MYTYAQQDQQGTSRGFSYPVRNSVGLFLYHIYIYNNNTSDLRLHFLGGDI